MRSLIALLVLAAPACAQLPRFPTLHGGSVVFVAAGNLWHVDRAGGTAQRLTSDPGQDFMPRFSPDGRWIAYTASTEGNRDVYAIPAQGGVPRRLTYHSDVVPEAPDRWGPNNLVVGWTPDGHSVVYLARDSAETDWNSRLYTVPLQGGLPQRLPLDSGSLLTYGPDGHTIAYTRIFRDFRTWKRYDGGLAQKIATYDFSTRTLRQLTDWHGTDTQPLWFHDRIYFLSDRDAHRRLNLWCLDTKTNQVRQITHFTDYDIDFPSLGDTGIVFQQAGQLHVLDLPDETLHTLKLTVPDDGTRRLPRTVHADKQLRDKDTAGNPDYDLAPNGKRAAFSARGDIFTVPAEHGATRNLTATSNADEDHPAFSPDGNWIAYTTDASGNQQIAVRLAAGGPERVLTNFKEGFYYTPTWSPDGSKLVVADGEHRLWLVDVGNGTPRLIYQDKYTEVHDARFSPDSRLVAFSGGRPNGQLGLHIFDIEAGRDTPISHAAENDSNPVFSPDGDYLYFLSSRHENPTFSQSEQNVATLKTVGIYAAALRRAEPSPFAPRSDESHDPQKPAAHTAKALRVDMDGLIDRAVPVPVEAANIISLDARDDKLVYQVNPPDTIEGKLPGEKSSLHLYDLAERKDATVTEDLESYALSADGKRVLVRAHGDFTITDLKAHGGDEKKLDLGHMRATVYPVQEWAEMFENAWRLQRDLFFNPTMNGTDWRAIHDQYAKLLPAVASRGDLTYVIGQMLGELGNSHTYVGGGDDLDSTEKVPVSLLGADFTADAGGSHYVFSKIFRGDNSRPEYRAPLAAPGLDVREGDALLAVNGHPLAPPANPFSLFAGAQSPLTLTIARAGGKPRDIQVEPVKNELSLRELDMIDRNRATVDRLSHGRIAYIYLSNMSALGMEQFVREFYPQTDKEALIVDDRWNGGGFIDQILLERLRRVLVGMDVNRERGATTIPQQIIRGPKICLINHWSASDGDIFPYYFRQYGLGPLLGTRTWGGVRGIRGEWGLLDGGYITIPEESVYGLDSQWAIENHGVDPDITLESQPGDLEAGHDRQLETAIDVLMKKLPPQPQPLPAPPAWLPAYPPPHP